MAEPRILGVITARGGSKGIPRKNIKLLAGKPLVEWSIEAAKCSKLFTHWIVSTDDDEIACIARRCNALVLMRPKELAQDETSQVHVIRHAILEMEASQNTHYDYAVILQPTSPFRLPEYIDETIKVLIREGTDSAVTVYEIEGSIHPAKIKKFENGRILPYCIEEAEGVRRQDLPTAFKRSGDVYAMTRACLIEKNRLYGDSVAGYIVPKDRVIDIDVPIDWILAEAMAKELY